MSKHWKPKKKTVELHGAARPSRIRRDPVRAADPSDVAKKALWRTDEWEVRLALVGIVLFALGISAAVIDIGEILSH